MCENFQKKILGWAKKNYRDFSWRQTSDPYKICVAEILLHQTFAKKVEPVYNNFINNYPNLERLSKSRLSKVQRIIYPLGFLYRAERLRNIAKYSIKHYGGAIPNDKQKLLKLPGVGTYTATAILCFAHGHDLPIIDVNVVRVYSRYFGVPVNLPNSSPSKEIENIAHKILPAEKSKAFNYGVLDFASLICTHYNPKHENCPLKSFCAYMQ